MGMVPHSAEATHHCCPEPCHDAFAGCRYSPQQLYSVVAAVEHYREFVPWCQKSELIKKEDDKYLEAVLEVGFKLFVERCAGDKCWHCALTVTLQLQRVYVPAVT